MGEPALKYIEILQKRGGILGCMEDEVRRGNGEEGEGE